MPFGLPNVLSALGLSGGAAQKAVPNTVPPPPTQPAARRASPGTGHPVLGNRLLNVGPNATPVVLAAALRTQGDAALKVDEQVGGEQEEEEEEEEQEERQDDSSAMAAAMAAEIAGPIRSLSPVDGSSGDKVSLAVVEQLLSGLRASLESIRASRAQYARVLADRENFVMELKLQLREKDQRIKALEDGLHRAQSVAVQAQEDAEAAAALAAAAAEHVQLQAVQIAQATADVQAAQEAALAAVEEQRLLLLKLEQEQEEREQQAAAQQAPPAAPVQPQAPAAHEVVVYYRPNNWRQVYMHYSADGKGWTSNPGVLMEGTKDGNVKVLRVPAGRLECVFNNGKGEWDSPPGNYKITSPGTYRAERGNLRPA